MVLERGKSLQTDTHSALCKYCSLGNSFSKAICGQGWESDFGNVIGYRLLVILFKM